MNVTQLLVMAMVKNVKQVMKEQNVVSLHNRRVATVNELTRLFYGMVDDSSYILHDKIWAYLDESTCDMDLWDYIDLKDSIVFTKEQWNYIMKYDNKYNFTLIELIWQVEKDKQVNIREFNRYSSFICQYFKVKKMDELKKKSEEKKQVQLKNRGINETERLFKNSYKNLREELKNRGYILN